MIKKILLIGVIMVFLLSIVPISLAMNKGELIDALASGPRINEDEAGSALTAFINVIAESLKVGNRVSLVGFGSFSISKRTIGTGQTTGILESVTFKAGDMPFLPNVGYTTTEDIAKKMASMDFSADMSEGQRLTEDQYIQFINNFTNIILNTLQAGMEVNVGEDFGTFSVVPNNAKIHKGTHSVCDTTICDIEKGNTKRPRYQNIFLKKTINVDGDFRTLRIPSIGHVDHGKKTWMDDGAIQLPVKKVIRFQVGADFVKTIA